MTILHSALVDLSRVKGIFSNDLLHRHQLQIPFKSRLSGKTLCIIGQNPSQANEKIADKTINYLEEFVFRQLPQYSQILMLNLFTRIDTHKEEKANLIHPGGDEILRQSIVDNEDFLMIFGKMANQGAYHFLERALEVRQLLKGKNVFKLDIGSSYAPHPGNPKIFYRNFDMKLVRYDFSDC